MSGLGLLMAVGLARPAVATVTQVDISGQVGDVQQIYLRDYLTPDEYTTLQNGGLPAWFADSDSREYNRLEKRLGRIRGAYQLVIDPLINVRVEIENQTDSVQYYAVQYRFATELTAGPTFVDAFANLEVIDANEDGLAFVSSGSTWFEVIDEPGGEAINGSRNLGELFFYNQSAAGKINLFDVIGDGPNSDDFDGDGFNFMRFQTNGYLSPGDKVIVTGMGAYATDAASIPARYELPAVPEPATGLIALGLGMAILRGRRHP